MAGRLRVIALAAFLSSPALAVRVVHSNNTVTTWSPDAWGDGSGSTATGGLSGAIAAMVGGDQVFCTHGVNYAAPTFVSAIVFPNFSGTKRAYILTDKVGSLPKTGTRISTGDLANMCQITATAGMASSLVTSNAAPVHDITVRGVQIGIASGGTNVGVTYLVNIGVTSASPAILPQNVAKRITFEQVIIGGTYDQNGPCTDIGADGYGIEIRDSILDEAKGKALDCHAIYSTSCIGCLVYNSQISGNTENFLNGGDKSSTPGYISRGWTFVGSDFSKNIRWRRFFSNQDPSTGDPRVAAGLGCVYYAAQSHGELWQNNGTGTTPSNTSTGNTWECQSGSPNTWNPLGSQTIGTFYGNATITGGQLGSQKNNWEAKYGTDFRIWGSTMRNMWASLQNEMFMLNGPDSSDINSTNGMSNVVLEYSILRDSSSGIAMGSGFAGAPTPSPVNGIVIQHNVLDSVSQLTRGWCGNAVCSQPSPAILGSPKTYDVAVAGFPRMTQPGGVVIQHNTIVNSVSNAPIFYIAGANATTQITATPYPIGHVIRNNIFTLGGGVTGDCGPAVSGAFGYGGELSVGCVSIIQRYWAPNGLFANNVISLDGKPLGNVTSGGVPLLGSNGPAFNVGASRCCFRNFLPTSVSTVLVNVAGGDYHVLNNATGCNPNGTNTTNAPTGNCHGAASDGSDPGADVDSVGTPGANGFTFGAITGAANPNLNFVISSVYSPSATTATVRFQQPTPSSTCTAVVSTSENLTSGTGSHSYDRTTVPASDSITGLVSGTFYYGKVICPDATNGGATNLTKFFTVQVQ